MPNPFQLTKLTQVHLQRLQSLGCHGQGAFQRTFLHVLHGTGLHGRGLVYQNFDFQIGALFYPLSDLFGIKKGHLILSWKLMNTW